MKWEILIEAGGKINHLEYKTLLFNIVYLHKGNKNCIPLYVHPSLNYKRLDMVLKDVH